MDFTEYAESLHGEHKGKSLTTNQRRYTFASSCPRRLAAKDVALSRRRSPVRIRSGVPAHFPTRHRTGFELSSVVASWSWKDVPRPLRNSISQIFSSFAVAK